MTNARDFNDKMYYEALEELNRRFPQVELSYRNSNIASIIAKGHGDQLTSTWMMRAFLTDIEDGFITYGQAVYIKDQYFDAVCEVKKMVA